MNSSLKQIIYFFITTLLLTCNSVWAYTMPAGIPEPSINFTQDMPDRPTDWSNEVAGYYYINQQTGSTSQTYGTPTAPRKYLPSDLTAGSYVEIADEYSRGLSSGYYAVKANGTDATWVANISGPVWIVQSEDGTGTLTKARMLLYGENMFVSDLNFKDGGKPQISSPTAGWPVKNIVVRNCDVDGGGISVNGNTSNAVDGVQGTNNVVIYNNVMHDAGDVYATYDQDSHLMTVGAGVTDVWMLNNIAHTASGAGLQILGSSTRGTTSNIYAGDNEIYNVRQSGMWVKYGSNVVFSNNHVHDIISTTWSVSKGMGAQYEPDELWMINNRIHGMEYGIRIASTNGTSWSKNIYAIGNVIYDIRPVQGTVGTISGGANSSWQSAAIHIAGSNTQHIYNNLIFDSPNGIDTSSPGTIYIKNNIILDVTAAQAGEETGYHVLAEIIDPGDNLFMDNNYFGDNPYVFIHNKAYYDMDSLNTLDSISGNIQGTNIIDQTNIDAVMNDDFSSVDSTSWVDAGVDVSDVIKTSFTSIFPDTNGIDLGILGYSLIGSINIGPFALNGDVKVVKIPAKPKNVEVIQVP